MDLLMLLVAGAVAGTLAGLLGIGGGIVNFPVFSGVVAASLLFAPLGPHLPTSCLTSCYGACSRFFFV